MTEPGNEHKTFMPGAGTWLGRILRVREFLITLVIILSGVVMRLVTPYFLTASNFLAILIGLVPSGLIVIGETMVLVGGGLDLSVGAVMALSGTLAGLFMLSGLGIALSVLLALIIGGLIGLLNGLLITKIHVNALIATLGTMTIARGVALVLTEGFTVTNLPGAFSYVGQGSLLGMPPMVWLMILVIIVADIAMRHTTFCREIYYVGGNERAALLSGIPVDRVKMSTYVISGLLSASAGIMLASRLMAGTPTAGNGMELSAIAAAVIGGASLVGGEGTILGAALGTFFLAIISNASIILGISIYWQGVVTGIILVLTVAADMFIRQRSSPR